MAGLARWNGDEKPMLTYMLTASFWKLWFSFPDLRCLKNVPSAIAGYQNVNVNVNGCKFFLKIWGVLTNMLTLFLLDAESVIWFVNVNVKVKGIITVDYAFVNVNVWSPWFSIFC